ncbi:hypothetical protein TYRP_006066 [Tyrophagus putrescentiae]|nr:hypothetical protein TYRP_006066 [Tyrophagus putrescentiae]
MDPAGAAEFSTIIVRNESGSYGLGDDRQPPEQPRHEPLEERTTSFDNAGLLVHHQQQQLIFESCQQQKNDDDTTRQPDHSNYSDLEESIRLESPTRSRFLAWFSRHFILPTPGVPQRSSPGLDGIDRAAEASVRVCQQPSTRWSLNYRVRQAKKKFAS